VFFYLLFSFRALLLPSATVADTVAAEAIREVILAVEAIREDTIAVEAIQGVIITDTVRPIMAVGTAGGDTGTIPVVIGGDLDFILIPVGGGPIHTPIHIPTTIPIHHIPTPIMFLHRRSLSSLLHIANRSNNNLTTGTTARIRRATIPTSKVVREAGYR